MQTNPEARHQQIQDTITAQATSFANEPGLQTVIRTTYFKEKETIKRGNLARLLKTSKQQVDLDHATLAKESTIARNKIVLEHVVAERNMREWKDQILAEIHEERQQRAGNASALSNASSRLRKATSQAVPRRSNLGHTQRGH